LGNADVSAADDGGVADGEEAAGAVCAAGGVSAAVVVCAPASEAITVVAASPAAKPRKDERGKMVVSIKSAPSK
jgi:hypothetical protein